MIFPKREHQHTYGDTHVMRALLSRGLKVDLESHTRPCAWRLHRASTRQRSVEAFVQRNRDVQHWLDLRLMYVGKGGAA